ncbi:hypothetical protein M409DRAFT_67484 [Zasmidium cellare ATCC 36951]|uniref:C2H2-type domain-containing protein n=1 Tax=Zasmidium cellare ATCC 36951 TaxID=1080233 RepID=A0A6A6CIK9_ZASCE|nr:uncharacterized protein M409DRAFT_67484 [Zasmidium cellare ATCC 36951]KAF2165236.1 hypothetical protein M409DRAFT_67484 [Zasmidium cellare ATCC 36951]
MEPSGMNVDFAVTEVQHVPFQESHQVKCTHSDCEKLFETDKEMRRHKRDNPQHFYCYKCDVDCEDWEDLTRHKVDMMAPFLERRVIATDDNKPKHIVCEFCGEDFKSFGGRKLHRQQAHPADQDIECPGCKSHFVRAANMIVHIEDNGCSEIRPHELFRAICHKFVVKQVLRAPDKFKLSQVPAGPAGPAVTDGTETHDQDDGGVSLLDQEDEAQLAGYKPLSSSSDYMSTASPTPSRASMNVRPAPPSQASLTQSMRNMSITTATPRSVSGTSAGSYDQSYPYLAPDTSGAVQVWASSSGKPSAWGTSSNASKKLFAKAQPTPLQAGDWNAVLAQREEESLADDGKNLMKARWWDPSSQDYNPDLFKDESTGVYTCRFPDCMSDGIAFHALVDLQDHITMFHLPGHFQCPSCFKRFKKASALVGHAENTRKCNVRASGGFKSLIAEITGGLLDAKSVSVPKIYRPDTALVKFGKEPTHGIMDNKFTAKSFDT